MRAAAELATELRGKLCKIWRALPCLTDRDPHASWDLIASSGASGSATEIEWNEAMKGLEGMLALSSSGVVEAQMDQFRRNSDNPARITLIGTLRRARGAITDREAYHPGRLQRFIDNTQDAFILANALSGESADSSKIGKEALESASIVGIPDQDRDNMGPRAKHLKVAEIAASA